MFDGGRILDNARRLAFPRYPGSQGDSKAISLVETQLKEIGLETTVEWFSYDIRLAQNALRFLLVFGALLIAGAGALTVRSPIAGLALLAAAVAPAAVFLAWTPWLEKFYRREGRTRTANIVGHRVVESPRMTLMLMAHHDSKSQSLSLPIRIGLTVMAVLGALALTGIALATFVSRVSATPWFAPAAGGVAALAALALSTMRSGNDSPGGVDNAGSVAVILEVARRLTDALPDDIDLLVLSTGAEEDHMVGAMRWLDDHADRLSGPIFCLNLDGAGAPGRLVLIERYGFGRLFTAEISAAARRAAARLGIRPRAILMLPGLGIDAIPFAHRGVPCLTFASGSLGRATLSIHTPNDTPEHLDPANLARIADLVYETSMELCTGGPDRDPTAYSWNRETEISKNDRC